METAATLNEFEALNEQLAALVEAGVPLDVGIGQSTTNIAQEVKKINSTVARRINRGESLVEAIEDDEDNVPAGYRSVVQFGLQTGNLTAGLDDANRIVESDSQSRTVLEMALIYPLIVCALAYAGLVVFCLYFVPILQGVYDDFEAEAGSGLRVLLTLRETMPLWVASPPLALVGWALWRLLNRNRPAAVSQPGLVRWLPGMSRIRFDERCSRFASSLAALISSQVPLSEALRTAGDSSGDAGLRQGGKLLSDTLGAEQVPADDSSIQQKFPPFLRWAIWNSEETTGRAEALRIAERVYRESALRRSERLRAVAPMVAVVFIGGTATLLYGLALFVPVTQLVRMLSG